MLRVPCSGSTLSQGIVCCGIEKVKFGLDLICSIIEPPHGKTNNVVSEQVQYQPACTVTEAG